VRDGFLHGICLLAASYKIINHYHYQTIQELMKPTGTARCWFGQHIHDAMWLNYDDFTLCTASSKLTGNAAWGISRLVSLLEYDFQTSGNRNASLWDRNSIGSRKQRLWSQLHNAGSKGTLCISVSEHNASSSFCRLLYLSLCHKIYCLANKHILLNAYLTLFVLRLLQLNCFCHYCINNRSLTGNN